MGILENISAKPIGPEMIIDGEMIPTGEPYLLKINAGKLPSDNKISVFAHVYNTGIPGPCVLVLGGIHGDEINGIEIVRKVIVDEVFKQITKGSIIVIPLLNVYGFINFSRDVTDGKDVASSPRRSYP
jgi:uncharacterized protein